MFDDQIEDIDKVASNKEGEKSPELKKLEETIKVIPPCVQEVLIENRDQIIESTQKGESVSIEINDVRGGSFGCLDKLPGIAQIPDEAVRQEFREKLTYNVLSELMGQEKKTWLQSRSPGEYYMLLSMHATKEEFTAEIAAFVQEKGTKVVRETMAGFADRLGIEIPQEISPGDYFRFGIGNTLKEPMIMSLYPSKDGQSFTVAENVSPDVVPGAIMVLGDTGSENPVIIVEADEGDEKENKIKDVKVEKKGRSLKAFFPDTSTSSPKTPEPTPSANQSEDDVRFLAKFSVESYFTPQQISEMLLYPQVLGKDGLTSLNLGKSELAKNFSSQVASADLSGYSNVAEDISNQKDKGLSNGLLVLMNAWHSRMHEFLNEKGYGMDEIGGDGSQLVRVEGKGTTEEALLELIEAQEIWQKLLTEAGDGKVGGEKAGGDVKRAAEYFNKHKVGYKMSYLLADTRLSFIGKGNYVATELIPDGSSAKKAKEIMYSVKSFLQKNPQLHINEATIIGIDTQLGENLKTDPSKLEELGLFLFGWEHDGKTSYFVKRRGSDNANGEATATAKITAKLAVLLIITAASIGYVTTQVHPISQYVLGLSQKNELNCEHITELINTNYYEESYDFDGNNVINSGDLETCNNLEIKILEEK